MPRPKVKNEDIQADSKLVDQLVSKREDRGFLTPEEKKELERVRGRIRTRKSRQKNGALSLPQSPPPGNKVVKGSRGGVSSGVSVLSPMQSQFTPDNPPPDEKIGQEIKKQEWLEKYLKNQREVGKTADVAEFKREWSKFFAGLRTAMEAFPAKYKMQYPQLTPEGLSALKVCLEQMAREVGVPLPATQKKGVRKRTPAKKAS